MQFVKTTIQGIQAGDGWIIFINMTGLERGANTFTQKTI